MMLEVFCWPYVALAWPVVARRLLQVCCFPRVVGRAVLLPIVMPIVTSLGGRFLGQSDDENEDGDSDPYSRPRRERRDPEQTFRARAQSGRDSFDDALARRQGGRSGFDAQGAPDKRGFTTRRRPSPFEDDGQDEDHMSGSDDFPSLRDDRRRSRRDSRRPTKDDEVFGGMLDDDGDGYADV